MNFKHFGNKKEDMRDNFKMLSLVSSFISTSMFIQDEALLINGVESYVYIYQFYVCGILH